MVVYDYLKQVENDMTFLMLIKKGIIPLSILDKKVYYERYLYERKTHDASQAITNVTEEYHVSERTVYRAIKLMTE